MINNIIQIDYISREDVAKQFNIQDSRTRKKFEEKYNLKVVEILPRKTGYRLSDINKIIGNTKKAVSFKKEVFALHEKWIVNK